MNDQDDTFKALEDELRKLKPSGPSADLQSRVFAIFDDAGPDAVEESKVVPVPQETFLQWFRPIAAAAAVLAIFLGAVFLLRGSFGGGDGTGKGAVAEKSPEVMDAEFRPVKAGNVIRRATDEGVTLNDKNQPVRRVRYEYSDRYQWIDENGNSIELSVPQERQLLVPLETD